MKIVRFIIGVAFFGAYINTTQAQSDTAPSLPPSGQLCISCHGAQGQGMEPLGPRLAGLSTEYLVKQISDFQAGHRLNATMQPMAMVLQGESVSQVAAYFSAQTVPVVTAELRGQHVTFTDTAARLAYQGDWARELPACVTCHGPSGLGGGLFPRLAGQQASYIKTQLQAWQAGTRKGDVDGMMASVANKLTIAEIDALANYFANLK
ncbi:c-type cytochrome [Shewanella profunda]|uniref:c-type cytochrome n=1 Tax=Shewanella profunda TaxID=254793 RepID=UPI00200E3540|nr:c-type cytochrome [Shewanella profunda]MCL1091726.1 c-type cytochrome [Shewanella profunda]